MSLIILVFILTLMAAVLTIAIIRSEENEESNKRTVLEGIAAGIAPSIWGYYNEMAAIILDDFVIREDVLKFVVKPAGR